ncbi:MAG TPA: Rrf2 family transcriptional regulator [Bacillota bacterium]|jgi:Rrf2 family cysteine metabolism transcriptional repressor|nr:Rrf2 family transcriptional regulator [Bacillota bacterium]HOL09874.1 Rrf2 family transcriptional regulator [Bacillota bacterium]HPO97566.1 Rrf2 family transcriptional regulator [Bacillota bacterium]
MRISTKGRYGLRAMVDLAMNSTDGPVPLRQIAERQLISDSYLEQVFTSLRKNGLVIAARGAQGGYELNRPAQEITVGEILRALEGPIEPVHCVGKNSKTCEREKDCITHSFWEELNNTINQLLDNTTLADLAERARSSQNMYYI